MTPTEEIEQWIAKYGNARDALNVALARLNEAYINSKCYHGIPYELECSDCQRDSQKRDNAVKKLGQIRELAEKLESLICYDGRSCKANDIAAEMLEAANRRADILETNWGQAFDSANKTMDDLRQRAEGAEGKLAQVYTIAELYKPSHDRPNCAIEILALLDGAK